MLVLPGRTCRTSNFATGLLSTLNRYWLCQKELITKSDFIFRRHSCFEIHHKTALSGLNINCCMPWYETFTIIALLHGVVFLKLFVLEGIH